MSLSAETALSLATQESPRDVVIIKYLADNSVGISWSNMEIEKLCYLKDVLDYAVAQRLAESFKGVEKASQPVPAPVAETKKPRGGKKAS